MKNKGAISFLSNVFYVFGSQILVLISGLIKALVIPLLLDLPDYGYWQIYVFYTVYVGVFTFGYGDGLYLKYGGCQLVDLPLQRIRVANVFYFVLLGGGAAALFAYAASNSDPQRQVVYCAVAANVVVLGITSIVSLILQAIKHFKGYAFLNSADKVFFTLALTTLFWEDFRAFKYLILIDLIAKILILGYLLLRYRQLFMGPLSSLLEGAKEFSESVRVGIQLLVANLSGMLVLGVGRIIIEYLGTLEGYAYYAFATSLAGIILIAISALSIALFPSLRQEPHDRYLEYFGKINRVYGVFVIALLTGYFPAVAFINLAAIEFRPALDFLNVMSVIAVLQGKIQLVNNTYYKALRLERQMLIVNLGSFAAVAILSVVAFVLTEAILAIAYVTLAVMVYRSYASELFLLRYMGGRPSIQQPVELSGLAFFLASTSIFSFAFAFGIWVTTIGVLLIIYQKVVLGWVRNLRLLWK